MAKTTSKADAIFSATAWKSARKSTVFRHSLVRIFPTSCPDVRTYPKTFVLYMYSNGSYLVKKSNGFNPDTPQSVAKRREISIVIEVELHS